MQKLSQIKPNKTSGICDLRMTINERDRASHGQVDPRALVQVMVLQVTDLRSGGEGKGPETLGIQVNPTKSNFNMHFTSYEPVWGFCGDGPSLLREVSGKSDRIQVNPTLDICDLRMTIYGRVGRFALWAFANPSSALRSCSFCRRGLRKVRPYHVAGYSGGVRRCTINLRAGRPRSDGRRVTKFTLRWRFLC
jgi:hypothetical protein